MPISSKTKCWPGSATITAVCALLILVTGCSTMARRLDVSAVHRIVPSQTSRADVESVFGRPPEAHLFANGLTVARYSFHHFIPSTEASRPHRRLHPGDLLLRSLTVLYDTNGVVIQKLHDESVTPIHRSWNGWVELGPRLPANPPAPLVKLGDPVERVIADFGQPMERWLWLNGTTAYVWYYYKDRSDKLGQIESRRLFVQVSSDGKVTDFALADYDPEKWFRRGAW